MRPDEKDLHFINSLLKPFFKQKHIMRTLAVIQHESISGWEKWLQVELASFLRAHDDVKSWGRESQYNLDKRVSKARAKCAVDFIIHQKNKHSHLALEVKQINLPSRCINSMTKDIAKLNKIKNSDFDIRSVWCVGVHLNETIDSVQREIVYYAGKNKVNINRDLVVSEKIGKSGYTYTII